MRKLLVTAFKPFGGNDRNPTIDLTAVLKMLEILGMIENFPERWELVNCNLPTSYGGAAKALNKVLKKEKPDAVILTGLASGRSEVCLEFCALNVKAASIPDNDGETADGQPVVEGAPNALFTQIDLPPIVQRIKDKGIPCRVSYHAGTFVCNSTYYHLLLSGVKGVFMHIPDDELSKPSKDGENAPFLPLKDSLKALETLVAALTES